MKFSNQLKKQLTIKKKNSKMVELFHVTPIENKNSIMRYGLIDDVREMGIYFSDDDDSAVKWIMKRTEGKYGYKPKQLLLCTIEIDENDPLLFKSQKGKQIEDNLIKCKSYFYQNHIPSQNIYFELVEIKNENEWDYIEIENNFKSVDITSDVIKNHFEKFPTNSLGMGYDSNGNCFPISVDECLINDNDFKIYYESGLNRKIGMINHGYQKDKYSNTEINIYTKYRMKISPLMASLGMAA